MRSTSDFISRRALGVDASGIRKVFDLAAKMKDPINLSIGLPDFDVPEAVKAAAIDAIKSGQNRYTQTQGIEPLRQRLRAELSGEMGRDVGEVLSEAEVRQAVEISRRHNLLLISDEIYEPFLYGEGSGFGVQGSGKSALPSAGRMYDNTIILRGFSKSHAMTGWRLGYAAGPAEIIAQMTKLQQYTYVCAPSPLQHAALKAMDVPMKDAVAAYRRKRDIAYEGLRGKFEVTK